jgi:hypothetical protein
MKNIRRYNDKFLDIFELSINAKDMSKFVTDGFYIFYLGDDDEPLSVTNSTRSYMGIWVCSGFFFYRSSLQQRTSYLPFADPFGDTKEKKDSEPFYKVYFISRELYENYPASRFTFGQRLRLWYLFRRMKSNRLAIDTVEERYNGTKYEDEYTRSLGLNK